MSCYHPKLAYKRYNPELGKYIVRFGAANGCPDAVPIKIPCGKCIGCLRDRASQWAVRCACEYETTPNKLDCWFLTLTYRDDSLRWAPAVSVDDDGVVADDPVMLPTLRKRDLQLWIKRCRRDPAVVPRQLRYLACGEYGGHTARPHYHMIAFGLRVPDARPYKSKDSTSLYYTSAVIDGLWQHGSVMLARYDYHTADYVAKYMVKQDPADIVDGRERPCLLMSRRPGLGRAYYDLHKDDISLSDKVYTSFGPRRPPVYYDRIDRVDRPDDLIARKSARDLAAKIADQQALAQTDKPDLDRLADDERALLARKRSRGL